MNEEILKLADLSNVKVGDTIWTTLEGNTKVTEVDPNNNRYPISTGERSYTLDGKYGRGDKYPSAFTKNPFEKIDFQERWMMVSGNGVQWEKRKVFIQKNGKYIAWSFAEDEKSVLLAITTAPWKYAKEIPDPKELELTLEQIAEKFGVSVESIKIKK